MAIPALLGCQPLWSIIFFFSGILLSAFSLRALLPILRKRFLDDPNKPNSAHANPIPSGGGIVFVVLAVIFGLLSIVGRSNLSACSPGWLAWIPLLCLPLAIVGMVDDQRGLSVWVRFAVQFLTAGVLLSLSPQHYSPWTILPLLIAGVAIINFINFIDGMDGVLGGSSVFLLLAAAISFSLFQETHTKGVNPLPSFALIGAILGFLYWNWSPAKVFMGDVGSTFIGSIFIGYVLQQTDVASAISLLLVAFPLLADAGGCVIRRIREQQPILKPHKLMLYQRLNQRGWKHSQVAFLYTSLTAWLAITHILGGLYWVLASIVCQSLICVWLDQSIAVPFMVSLRRSQSGN